MKQFSLFISIFFVLCMSFPAYAVVSWTNAAAAGNDAGGPVSPTAVADTILEDFQTSARVTLSLDTNLDGSLYGVAAGHVVSGTRIYTSHSHNAQIEFTEPGTTGVSNTTIPAAATTALAAAVIAAGS